MRLEDNNLEYRMATRDIYSLLFARVFCYSTFSATKDENEFGG